MKSAGGLLRKAAIFAAVAGLGFLLVRMVESPADPGQEQRPRIGSTGSTGTTQERKPTTDIGDLVGLGERIETRSVKEIQLEDGSRVAFEEALLWGASWESLPAADDRVRRMRIVAPVVHLREKPRTRADLDRAVVPVTTVRAERGLLEHGPDGRSRLLLEGAVEAEILREGTPWTFHAGTATLDMETGLLIAPGTVRLVSEGVEVTGKDLRASDRERTATLQSDTAGTLRGARGARVGGGGGDEPLHFRCTGPFDILDTAPEGPGEPGRTRIRLKDAVHLEQGDGTLAGDNVVLLLARTSTASTDAGETRKADVESILAEGNVRMDAGRDMKELSGRRSLHAEADRLEAFPLPAGGTASRLMGEPKVRIEEVLDGRTVSIMDVMSGEPARIVTGPDGDDMEATFPGGARGRQWLPGMGPDGTDLTRDITARELRLHGRREGGSGGAYRPTDVVALQEARFEEGERTASADRLRFEPLPDGGSRVKAEGNVAIHWPSAGGLDPLGPLGEAAVPPGDDPGSLLLRSPGTVTLEAPRAGGGMLLVEGGALVRRVVGEREMWSLGASTLQVDLLENRGGVGLLDARGGARLAGKGEGAGERAYDFTGDRIVVRNTGLSDRPDAARLDGVPARALLSGEDGRPLLLEAPVLHFNRTTGAFSAEGPVRGSGVLPDSGGATAAGGNGPRPVTLEAGGLSGRFEAMAEGGRSKLAELNAFGNVVLGTSSETAEGATLKHDGATGVTVLRGEPARVRSGSMAFPDAGPLVDLCEAPELTVTFAGGEIASASAVGGGRFVRHRVAPPGDTSSPPVERLEANCDGPMTYGSGETTLKEKVRIVRHAWEKGAFVERENLSGADMASALYSRGVAGSAGLVSATAVSSAGSLRVQSLERGWDATGVSKAFVEPGKDEVRLEALPGSRFQFEREGLATQCRSVIFDYRKDVFKEIVGGSAVQR